MHIHTYTYAHTHTHTRYYIYLYFTERLNAYFSRRRFAQTTRVSTIPSSDIAGRTRPSTDPGPMEARKWGLKRTIPNRRSARCSPRREYLVRRLYWIYYPPTTRCFCFCCSSGPVLDI